MRTKKKVLSLILAAAMILSLLPTGVLAVGTETARAKTLTGAQSAGTVAYAAAPSGTPLTKQTDWNGTLVVTGNTSVNNVTVTGNTTLWLSQGATLTVGAATGTSYSPGSTATPGYSRAGGTGKTAITINADATLKIEGPGKLIVLGGLGGNGEGYNYAANTSIRAGTAAYSAAGGGMGGFAIDNKGTLEFGTNLSGGVKITGGVGGNGEGGKSNATGASTSTLVGGTGGTGGMGGVAVSNAGTIIFNQDNGNSNLTKTGDYANGTVNIKGGTGGTGGKGGDAGTASVTIVENKPGGDSSSRKSNQSKPTLPSGEVAEGAYDGKPYSTYDTTATQSDTFTNYPTKGGNAGTGGSGNYGVSGGSIVYNRGVSTIEGGNGVGHNGVGAKNSTVDYMSYPGVGTAHRNYTQQTEAIHTALWTPTPDTDPATGTYSWVEPPATGAITYYFSLTHHDNSNAGVGGGGNGAAGIYNTAIKNNGGTNYITGGYSSAGVQAAAGTVTATAERNTTGSLYIGNDTGYGITSGGVQAVRVNRLEGLGDFAASAKNFYVLNNGDKWTDADGTVHTSKGLVVGTAEYTVKDLYVSPQGYLYLTGVNAGDKVEFDLAVNPTLSGSAGETKAVKLNQLGSGVYRFVGTGAGVTARYAEDSTDAAASYDSSFDMVWLASVNFGAEVLIDTAPRLAAIAWAVNNGVPGAATASYKLTESLNLGSFNWTPIGTKLNPFMGTFNGNGKTLSNLTLAKIDSTEAYGLFGYVADNNGKQAKISNFKMNRVEMTTAHSDTFKNNSNIPIVAVATSGGNYNFKTTSSVTIDDSAADLYVGVAVGHAVNTVVDAVTVTDVPIAVTASKTAKLGGLVGYAQNSYVQNSTVQNTSDKGLSATAAGDVYVGGVIGHAEATDVTVNTASGYDTVSATVTGSGAAWAGGAIGKITGTERTAAVATNNKVYGSATTVAVKVTATAVGADKDAHAGGILGEGLEVAAFSNTFLAANNTGANAVTAYAPGGTAWAGGLLGHVINEGYGRIAVSDMTIKNIAVTAKGAFDAKAGAEAYAGGVVGQGIAKNGVELTNLNVNGTGASVAITADGTAAAYAGRLAGNVNKATVINCTFDNATAVNVSATSSDAEAYVGGLVGKLDESGSVNSSGVWMTNVEATAAAGKTAWAGGLLGYADKTSITNSSVNFKKSATNDESFASSTLTVNTAGTTFAGGIAGQIKNGEKTLNTADEHTYKINHAVSVTMKLPATGVTAGGLYGELNDALIGTSYARDYIITMGTDNTTPPVGTVAGVVGHLWNSELIAVYGVGKDGAVITDYPGMYSLGKDNTFYSSYVLHNEFAPKPEKDNNIYGNTYYVKADGALSLIPGTDEEAEEQDKPLVDDEAKAAPYYTKKSDGTYELKPIYGGTTYQFTQLTGIPAEYFNAKEKANDSLWNLVHFYRDKLPGVLTTRFEQRLGYAVSFNRKSGTVAGNFACPTFVTPYAFTLAVQPGLDYGHIKKNVGSKTYSTYNEPGTKTYTKDTKLIFTAEEQATLPQDKVFYVFTGWKYIAGKDTNYLNPDGTKGDVIPNNTLIPPTTDTNPIRINTVDSFMSLTAVFERRDNQIRGEINKALSDAMKAVLAVNPDMKDELNALLTGTAEVPGDPNDPTKPGTPAVPGDPQKAANLMLDELYKSVGNTPNLQSVLDVFNKWIGTDAKTDLSGLTFAQTYPASAGAEKAWKTGLIDKWAVVNQIVRDAVEEMMAADRFKAGSYDTDITEIGYEPKPEDVPYSKGDKLDYVDVRVDLFTTGSFPKYVESQTKLEAVTKTPTDAPNGKPTGIGSITGTELTLNTLFPHGAAGGVYLSYTDPAKANSAGEVEGAKIWVPVRPDKDGKYIYDVDVTKLQKDDKDQNYYLYFKEVDENGYEVTTRVKVGYNTVASENTPVNDNSANLGIGDGNTTETKPLRSEHTEMWYGDVDLLKGGALTPGGTLTDKENYYGQATSNKPVTFTSKPISGAYTEGLYVEIDATLVADLDALKTYVGAANVLEIKDKDGKTVAYEVKLTGTATTLDASTGLVPAEGNNPSFSTKNTQPNVSTGKLDGSVEYTPATGFVVKAKYVNLIGELNAAADIPGDDTVEPPVAAVKAVDQIHNLVADPGFGKAMGLNDKVLPAYDKLTEDGANPIDTLLLTYRPTEDGYPDAAAVKAAATYLTALQELENILKDPANTPQLSSLTPADLARLKEFQARAENLLAGKDYKGSPIDPVKLDENLSMLYTTGNNLFHLLNGVYYDSVVITIKTNMGAYMKQSVGGPVGKAEGLTTGTLYADGAVTGPAKTMFSMGGTPDSITYVVGKNKEATLVVDKKFFVDGYELTAIDEAGKPVAFAPAVSVAPNTSVGSYEVGDFIAVIGAPTQNLTYTINFAKRQYAVTLPASTPNMTAAITSGLTGGKAEHGTDVVITITPEDGYVVVPGTEIACTYTPVKPDGTADTPISVTAKVAADGTVTLPNVTGAVAVTDFGDAVIKLKGTEDALDGFITNTNAVYPGTDRDKYTPATWTGFQEALNAAKEVQIKAAIPVGDVGGYATEEEKAAAISGAYNALVEAQENLIEQYELTPGNNFTVADTNGDGTSTPGNKTEIDTVYSGTDVVYLQDGVVQIGSKYYVQTGKDAVLHTSDRFSPGLDDNTLTGVTYTQGAPAAVTGKGTVSVDPLGGYTVKIPGITGPITDVTAATRSKSFTVLPGEGISGDKDNKTEVDQNGGSVPTYTLPNAEVTGIGTEKVETVVVTVKDESGKDFVVTVTVDGDGKATGVTVKPDGKTEIAVESPFGDTVLTGGTVADNIGTATVTGDQLQAIVDAYNKKSESAPKIVVGKDTKVSVEVTVGSGSGTGTPVADAPVIVGTVTVPTYTITPAPGKHVTGVTVDGKTTISAPTAEEINKVVNGDKAPTKDPATGNKTYVKTDDKGVKTTIVTDSAGKVLSAAVDPGASSKQTATFLTPTDITGPDYGKAVVTWKQPDKNTHAIDATFADNVYDFTSKQPAKGSVLVKTDETDPAASKGSVTHGKDAVITIVPEKDEQRVDPTGKVTITIPSVQGLPAVTITDTLKNLADKTKYPGLTVTGVKPDGGVVKGDSVTVTVKNVTGPLTVDASAAFRPWDDQTTGDQRAALTLALDELKKSIDLGDAIVTNKANGPYVFTGDEWEAFAGADDKGGKLADASEKLYDKLTKNDKLTDAITKAQTEQGLVDAVNAALGLTGKSKLGSITEVMNLVNGAKTELDTAIDNLTRKGTGDTTEIPVLPGLPGVGPDVGTDGGIDPGKKPVVSAPTNGGIAPSESITIDKVAPLPGKDLDKVTITVKDPTTGKEYIAEIPVNGGADTDGGIKVYPKNPDGSKGEEIPADKLPGGAIPDTTVGATEDKNADTVTIPGKTVQTVVDAITGKKDPATGSQKPGSGNGTVTDLGVTTKPGGGFDVGDTTGGGTHTEAETDGGITGNKPIVDTVDDSGASNSGTGNTTITPGTDGITVTPIKPDADSTYEGIQVTVTDPEGNTTVVFIPKDETPTAGNTTGDAINGFTTTVKPDGLLGAIEDATGLTGEAAKKVVVTDVKVVTDAVDVPVITPETGDGIISADDTAGTTVKPGAGDGTENLTIPNVKPAPGYKPGTVTVTVTDPVTGKEYIAEIPVNAGGNVGEDGIKVYDKTTGDEVPAAALPGGAIPDETKGATATDATSGGTDGKKDVTVPGGTLNAIIDAITGKTTDTPAPGTKIPGSGSGTITGVTVDGEREGHALPGSGEATGDKGVDMIAAPSVGDGSNAIDGSEKVLKPDENLVVDNIKLKPNYTLDGLEITLTDGTKVFIPADSGKAPGNTTVTITITKPDGTTESKDVTVPDNTGSATVPGTASDTEKVTVDGSALEAIIKDALGDTSAAPAVANTDITGVKVVTSVSDTVIGIPETGRGDSGTDSATKPTVSIVPGADESANDGYIDPKAPGVGSVVVDNIKPAKTHETANVTITVTVPTDKDGGTQDYQVTVPSGETAPDLGTLPAYPVKPDGTVDRENPVYVDLGQYDDKGGSVAAGEGTGGSDKVSVPTKTVADLIKELTPDIEWVDSPIVAGKVTDVQVNTDRVAHEVPSTANDTDAGLKDAPTVTIWNDRATSMPGLMDPSKGITVTGAKAADPKDETVTGVTVTTVDGVTVTAKTDGTITATDKDGNPVELPADLKATVTDEDDNAATDGPYTVTIPGSVLDTVLDAAGAQKGQGAVAEVKVNTETIPAEGGTGAPGATGTGAIKGRQTAGVGPDELVSLTQDLTVDNIKPSLGYEFTGVTATLTDGTTVYIPKQSVFNSANGLAQVEAVITTKSGTETVLVDVPRHVTTGVGTDADSQKMTIPGETLDELIKAALGGSNNADVARIDVNTKANGYILPPAADIVAKSNELTALTIKNSTDDKVADSSVDTETTPKNIVLPFTGKLVMELEYGEDDTGYSEYHTLSAITVGGVTFPAEILEKMGILRRENSASPNDHLQDKDERIVLDAKKLTDQYKLSTGKDFPGFDNLAVKTVPQNSQYASFISDYNDLQGMLDQATGKPTDDYAYGGANRAEYEELVTKLAEQFNKDSASALGSDNLSHLLDKKAVVEGLKKDIDDLNKAKQIQEQIDDLYENVDFDTDESGNPKTPLTSDQIKQIQDLTTEAGKLADEVKDQVWPGGSGGSGDGHTQKELDDLNGKLADQMGLDYLLSNLPTIPNVLGGHADADDDDSTWDVWADASGKAGGLKSAEEAMQKVKEKVEAATVDDDISDDGSITTDQYNNYMDQLADYGDKLEHELEDLARVFAKEYLTTDKGEYKPGADTSSGSSTNGIKENTPNIGELVSTGMSVYSKLPQAAKDAVNDLFHGPTLPELSGAVFVDDSAKTLSKEDILNALDKDADPSNKTHIEGGDLDGEKLADAVEGSSNTVSEWVDRIISLEPSYNALSDADKAALNTELMGQNDGTSYPDLLDKANELVADKFIKDNRLNGLGDIGDTLTGPQKDLVVNAESDWNSLTGDQKDVVNKKLEETIGKTFDDLLGMLAGKDPMEKSKETARKELQDYYDKLLKDNSYTDDEKAKLREELDKALAAVDKALDTSGVKNAVTDGKTAMDKVLPTGGKPVDPTPPSGGGSTSSGSNITVNKPGAGGSITAQPEDAKKGDKVTITIKPDAGYVVDKVTVKDSAGKELAVTDNGDGTYTFTMPDGKVTVDATFTKLSGDPYSNGVSDLLNVDDHIAYMNGRSGEVFAPAGEMTRAEVAQLFYNLLKSKDNDLGGKASFVDVDASAWYAKAVNTLANIGIVKGTGGGKFAPDRTITRAEFIVIATRFAARVPGNVSFTDVPESYWAHDEIGAAHFYGWVDGYSDGTFKPGANIARSEAVKIVNRMLDRTADEAYIDAHADLKRFPDVEKTYWAFYDIAEATNAHDFEKKNGAETWKAK